MSKPREVPKYPNVPLRLLLMRENIMTQLRPALTLQGFTDQQWRILRTLYKYGPQEPRELCAICCILSPSMAGILKRMESLEMITRSPSPKDKRRVLVKLNDKIIPQMLEVMHTNRKVYDQLWAAVGEQRMCNFLAELEAINHLIEDIDWA